MILMEHVYQRKHNPKGKKMKLVSLRSYFEPG